jgi:hypothetical protein
MTRQSLTLVSLLGAIGLAAPLAHANVSSTTMWWPTQWPAGRGEVWIAQIPYQSDHPVQLSGTIGSGTSCRAAVTNGVGNAAWLGPLITGNGGLDAIYNMGTPPLYNGSALIVYCTFGPADSPSWAVAYQ